MAGSGGECLQVAEATWDVRIFQAEMHMPKFRTEGFGLVLEHGYLLFNGEDVSVSTVIPLDVCMDSPVVSSEDLSDDEGVGVRASLNLSEEPGRKGVRNMVGINA